MIGHSIAFMFSGITLVTGELRQNDPRLALELEPRIAALLARRLTGTTALIDAMGG